MSSRHLSALCLRGAALAAALALGCGSTEDSGVDGEPPIYPVPGCEELNHATCDVRVASCQERLFALAQCLRGGERDAELPVVRVVAPSEYGDRLRASFAENPPPTPNHWENALVLLGLAAPGAYSATVMVDDAVTNTGGVYWRATKDIWVIDHGEATDEDRASVVLVHEFVHALQDREVNLTAFWEEHATSTDAVLAVRAVIEGEAELHETRYAASQLGLDPRGVDFRAHFEGARRLAADYLRQQASPYPAGNGSFPYRYGGRYMNFAWEKGGHDEVLARFASPPRNSHALMASVLEPLAEEVTPVDLPAVLPPAEWLPESEVALGAWGVWLALRHAPIELADAAAQGWRGDSLAVYSRATTQTLLVWQLDFATEQSAASFLDSLVSRNNERKLRQQTRVLLVQTNAVSQEDFSWATLP